MRWVVWTVSCLVILGITGVSFSQTDEKSAVVDTPPGVEVPDITPTYLANESERKVWDPEHVDDFSLTDQCGKAVTLADLKGRPWVASFIFTRCITQCPQMCSKIRDMLKEINKDQPNPVRFVTITIDPRHDSLEKIQEFAKIFGADPNQWLFLTGGEETINQLVRHGFKVAAWENFGTSRLPGMEFAHSMHLIHVDENSKILGRYESQNDLDLHTLQRVLQGEIETPKRHKPALVGTPIDPRVAKTLSPESGDGSREPEAADGSQLSTLNPQTRSPDPLANLPPWAKRLPATNAALNGLSTILLLVGFAAIKAKQVGLHKRMMLFAFAVSVLFLGCYLTYHFALHQYTGEHGKKFVGTPGITKVYYTILISHVILAAAVPVLTSMTIWRGLKSQWDSHRKWAKVTFPIWLYVSVTGVVIYWMLYHLSGPVA